MSFLQQSCEQTIFPGKTSIFLILTQQSEGWKNGVALSENIYKVIFAMERSKFQTILNIAFCFISLPLLWPLIKTLCYFAGSYRKRQLYQVKVNFDGGYYLQLSFRIQVISHNQCKKKWLPGGLKECPRKKIFWQMSSKYCWIPCNQCMTHL